MTFLRTSAHTHQIGIACDWDKRPTTNQVVEAQMNFWTYGVVLEGLEQAATARPLALDEIRIGRNVDPALVVGLTAEVEAVPPNEANATGMPSDSGELVRVPFSLVVDATPEEVAQIRAALARCPLPLGIDAPQKPISGAPGTPAVVDATQKTGVTSRATLRGEILYTLPLRED